MRLFSSIILCAFALISQQPPPVGYLSFKDALPLLELLNTNKSLEIPGTDKEKEDAWLDSVKSRDAKIRSRLIRGDEDTLVNFLLMGTSFTDRPRILNEEMALLLSSDDSNKKEQIMNPRIEDLIHVLMHPGNNSRASFFRKLVLSQGYEIDNPANKERLKQYLWDNLNRFLREQTDYDEKLASIKTLGHTDEVLGLISQLYKDRGLSLDTALPSSFAIDHSLTAMKAKGIFKSGIIRKVAIIGPGLDIINKDSGYDFYPEQTLQPFAVANSLLRSSLSNASDLQITTFDISPLSNYHLQTMIQAKPLNYTLHLLMDMETQPTAEFLSFWKQMGDRIGKESKSIPLPSISANLQMRTVSVKPQFIAQIKPVDLDIIYQNLSLPDNGKFDLMVATNIFVYYNAIEQSLASLNIEKMLAPSGVFLCNNALSLPPFSHLKLIGTSIAKALHRPAENSVTVFWYQHTP